MRLFSTFNPDPPNLLPEGGTALYYGAMLTHEEADRYFQTFMETIRWKYDELIMFNKHIVTGRKVAWFGEKEYDYTYSGITRHAHIWTPELRALKETVEAITGALYNSCLLNLYPTGKEGLSWHSDDEKEFGHDAVIASVSLGVERKFVLKHKVTGQTVPMMLGHDDLMVMKDDTQLHWRHSVPKMAKVMTPRINLTFRRIV